MANPFMRPYGANPYDTAETHGAGPWSTWQSPRRLIAPGFGPGNQANAYDRFSNSTLGRAVEGAAANAPILAGAAGAAKGLAGRAMAAKAAGKTAAVPKPRAAVPKAAPSVEPPAESLIQGRGELPSERAALQQQSLNPIQPLPPSPIPVNSPPPVVRDITPGPLSVIPSGPKPAMIPASPQPGAAIGSTGAKLRPHFTDPIETPSSPNTLIVPPKNVPATFPRGPGVSDARGTIPPHYTSQVPPLAVDSAMMGPAGLAAAGGAGAAALTAYIAKQKQAQGSDRPGDQPASALLAMNRLAKQLPGEQVDAGGGVYIPNVGRPMDGNTQVSPIADADPIASGLSQIPPSGMSPVQAMRNALGAIPAAAQRVAAGASRFGQNLMDSSISQSASPGAIRAILEMQTRRGGPSDPAALAAVQAERANEQYLGQKNATESGIAKARNALAGPNANFVSYSNAPVERYSEGPASGTGRMEGGFRQVGGQYNYTPTMSMGTGPERLATERKGPDLARMGLARMNAANKGYDVSVDAEGNTTVDATKKWNPADLITAKAISGQLPLTKQQLLRNRVAAMQRQADKEQWQSENLANYRFNRAEQKAMPQADASDPYEQTLRARAAMGDSNAMQAYAQIQASKAAQQQHADQIEVEREKNATDLYGKNLQGWQGEREAYGRSKQAQAWDMESMARKQQSLQSQLADPALQADPGKKLKLQNALDDVNNKFEQYEAMKYPTSPRPEYTPPVPPGRRGESTRRPILSRAEFQRRKAEQLAQQQAVQPPPPAAPVSPPVDEKEQLVPGTPTESTVNAFLQKEMEDKIGSGKMDRDQFVAYMKMHPQISKYGPDVVDKWVDSQRRSQRMTDQKKAAMLAAMNPLATPVTAAMSSLSDKFNLPEGFDAVKDYLSELFGGDPRPAQRMRAFGRSAAQ